MVESLLKPSLHALEFSQDFPSDGSCFVGGSTAAFCWGLTDEVQEKKILLCSRASIGMAKNLMMGATITTIQDTRLFEVQSIVHGGKLVFISSPAKTILDLLERPKLASSSLATKNYLETFLLRYGHAGLENLVSLLDVIKVGAVYKRLGFFLELIDKKHFQQIEHCHKKISKGNSYLEFAGEKVRLSSRWHLWVPQNLSENREASPRAIST
jgi:hypothetical protein